MGYQRINIIGGWIAFLISLVVYSITVEPTASFWDCGEFIATAYKLEVPHPPGAPFFLLIGRLFSMIAGDDVTQIAYWVNMLSVLSSAFTILFLFWTITHLAKRILKPKKGEETTGELIAIIGSGAVGALAFTFSDSFWFSAVEAEVYAMSSFFTAFVFWAILKWETLEDESLRTRWLLLIAYMMGLSIGVHLLNLVTIPAMALIVYFNYNDSPTKKGIITTLVIAGAVILIVMIGVIPGLASVAGGFEIFFVNNIGLPFGSGVIVFGLLFVGSLVYGIFYSIKKQKLILNTVLLGFTFIMIGYTSYAIVLIRSNYDTPIDENNPEDIMTYVSYLKREQYGNRPLFKGQYYTAELTDQKKGDPIYMKGESKYEIKDYKVDYIYDPKHTTIFPRMYSKSPDGNHQRIYQQITGLKPGQKPSFADNIQYLFVRQLGHMYYRYFMWNFSGRASDIQDADWVGLNDAFKKLPPELANNAGRNVYYMLPLLLGIIGILFQYKFDPKYFAVTVLLFFLTGIALVVYLNAPPVEPRERDYIYAGSYYAFAIWIGFAVLALYKGIGQLTKEKKLSAAIAAILCMGVPVLMASENWDDHDRSNRYFSIEAAKNYLDSCAPNAILFTGGDNDTFPLWYAQEVEGHRTDVRVIVLSYFNTDWYIEQMTRQAYQSEALPFGLSLENYQQGGLNDYLPVIEDQNIKGAINAKLYLNLIKREHPGLRVPTAVSAYNRVPAKSMFVNVDQSQFSELNILPTETDELSQHLTDKLVWRITGSGLEKKDLAIIDLIVNTEWKRPIYFNTTSINSINFDLRQHVVQEGLTYRLMPIKNPGGGGYLINNEVMYDNLMNNFHWKELNNPSVYYSEDYRSFCTNHRSAFNALAQSLINAGEIEKAKNVLLKCLEVMPDASIPYDIFNVQQISLLLEVGERDLALDIAEKAGTRAEEWLGFVLDEGGSTAGRNGLQQRLLTLNEIVRAFRAAGETELAAQYEQVFRQYYGRS